MITTEAQSVRAERFLEALDNIQARLGPFGGEKDLRKLTELQEDFRRQVEDLYQKHRRLNIGVVGQVKAGKSTFLNTLLFEGQEVLPKASTPKTAALTRMEYAEENALEIEYYSAEDWARQMEAASVDLDDDVYTAARELAEMVREREIKGLLDVNKCLEKGTERLAFETYEDLLFRLNDYVSVDGVYTPLVKSVSLYLHQEQFRGLCIVDTPGLNDPVVSRTQRTKEFLSVCDVVFFLSQSGSFLDAADWSLLSAQLPSEGVRRLVLIGSKYDSALRDVLRKKQAGSSPFAQRNDKTHADNLPDACRIASETLHRRARQQVAQQQSYQRQIGVSETVIQVMERCREPILFSAMACNMARKSPETYTKEEQSLAGKLSQFSDDLQADLQRIGDISPIQEVFREIVREKEQILQEKSESLVDTNRSKLLLKLNGFADETQKKCALLSANDRKQLMERKRELKAQENKIRAAISDVFSDCIDRLKTTKAEGIAEFRTARGALGTLRAKTGTKTEWHDRRVSDSKWYKPWSWGKSHTEIYSTTSSYTYYASSEAAEHLGQYARDAANRIESTFTSALNLKELRQKLCSAIIHTMDMGDARFDSSYFRLKVNELVDAISFPTVHIDASEVTEQIYSRFKGQVSDAQEMDALEQTLRDGLDTLFGALCSQFEGECGRFQAVLHGVNQEFQKALLSSLSEEFESLMGQLEKKEQEIARLKRYLTELEDIKREMEVR